MSPAARVVDLEREKTRGLARDIERELRNSGDRVFAVEVGAVEDVSRWRRAAIIAAHRMDGTSGQHLPLERRVAGSARHPSYRGRASAFCPADGEHRRSAGAPTLGQTALSGATGLEYEPSHLLGSRSGELLGVEQDQAAGHPVGECEVVVVEKTIRRSPSAYRGPSSFLVGIAARSGQQERGACV